MFRSHNKRIRIEKRGVGYELFWITENAQHIIDRQEHHSHRITLQEVERCATEAFFIIRKNYENPAPHAKINGFFVYNKSYYIIIAYITESYGRRCVIESCHVLSDNRLLDWCRRNPDLVTPPVSPAHASTSKPPRKS